MKKTLDEQIAEAKEELELAHWKPPPDFTGDSDELIEKFMYHAGVRPASDKKGGKKL